MKKYKYTCEQFNPFSGFSSTFDEKKLNEFLKDYGDEGWELIEVVPTNPINNFVYYFKKEIID